MPRSAKHAPGAMFSGTEAAAGPGSHGSGGSGERRRASSLRRLAHWCLRHRRVVLIAWLAVFAAVLVAAGTAGNRYASNLELPASDSQRAAELLEERFPAQAGDSADVVFHAEGGRLTDRRSRLPAEAALAEIAQLPHVVGVSSPFKGDGRALSADRRTGYASVTFDRRSFELPKDAVTRVIDEAKRASGPDLTVALGGLPIQHVQRGESAGSEAVGLMAAIIVLLLTFGSLVATGLPLATAIVALGTGLGLLTLATHLFDVADFAPQLAAMIGLGVGIDYALFIVTRYRAGLREGLEPEEATVMAMDTSGRAVLFAGTTVMVALLGMLLLGVSFINGMAVAASLAVLFTMVASLTLLPALLGFAGRRIDRLAVPFLGGSARAERSAAHWVRWAALIQRRPLPAALIATAILVTLSVPAFAIDLGSSDAGSDPPESTTRQAYDLLADAFGPGFNGPLLVAARLPDQDGERTLKQLSRAVAEPAEVASVAPPRLNPSRDTALLAVYPSSSPQSKHTRALLDEFREQILPPFERRTGATVHVGGPTAVFDDLGQILSEKLPLFIGTVVLISALLLMAVFRSVVVALKAIVMNMLSIGASFGVVVAIFQWGWLGGLVGIDRTGPIESFLPVMLFAIVFGLSMDYEVFLMSRIHEEWERRSDASAAVREGLAATGRVITAAAAIMVAVFLSFVLGDERVIKLFGIGLASAVFLDAIVIRTMLVPALMELFGRRAWWLPGWLDRALPRVNVEPPAVPKAVPDPGS